MTYQPCPIDTGHVVLGDNLRELVERLAEHNHDIWAQQRMREGWSFGPERNDGKKQHPDLVAYASLPESEKIYDRNSVESTLRAILALGFRIER